ncbi:P-loop containing nucleoside triphosphate hydrolase protein [Chaetomidium leptoderma]|uniref:Kinesin-like protein n=1 Tax=Chaetomidium leptoderma TaxID=669021 RepID=A0AAN6VVD3_9PEZI|nr:P-loop containing nucleoside triphosphate hydrolase protein [Chaetomidium leptoderma]
MDTSENAQKIRSGLRPPQVRAAATAPPSTAATYLQEMSDSQHNARAQMTGTRTGIPQKRTHAGSISIPEPKRKTLAEQAGEPLRSGIPPPGAGLPRPAMGVRGASIAALHSTSAATTSRRAPPGSFAKSVGPGTRPPISSRAPMPSRAPTSMGFSTNTRPRGNTRTRPATAMANREVEDQPAQVDQKKGMNVSHSSQHLRNKKSQSAIPQQPGASHTRQASRDISGLNKRFEDLSLGGQPNHHVSAGGQVVSKQQKQQKQPLSQQSQSDVQTERTTPSKVHQEAAARCNPLGPANSQGTPAPAPTTPPQINRFNMACAEISTLLRSCSKKLFSPPKSCSPTKLSFLTKDSNVTSFTGWDVDGRLNEFESQFKVMKEAFEGTMTDRKTLEEAIDLAKNRASDLEQEKQRLVGENNQLQSQLDLQRQENSSLQQEKQSIGLQMEAELRAHKYELEDKQRGHKYEMDELRRGFKGEIDELKREQREALEAMERHYRVELADEQAHRSKEMQELRTKLGAEQQDMSLEMLKKEREVQEMRSHLEGLTLDLDREQTIKGTLQQQIAEMSTTNMSLEDRMRGLRAKIDFLESDNKQQSDSFASMEARLQEALGVAEEARQKLIKEETERRVLFNKYQELKGNIRVMCRVRPVLGPAEGDEAKIAFPDVKMSSQIDVTGMEEKSSLGAISRKVLPFEFDRVFEPSVHNEEVFGEISQLVQSALDGYNVCIFCYGQTGSGKTYTMSSADGMIPRATHMIYDTITKLQEKSWTYTMEGSFVEVYNEELHDLLTPGRETKKLEIRHDDARKQTAVLNCKTVALDSPGSVETMLKQAQSNRSVAATKANERSSRSHSVFILKLVGSNAATHERCEGTLNLVDLAGSERLKHSQAEGDRMRETQNINKSLACLGDVIEALGRGSGHVPYRNSKLTHLLQYSLGGNSKTLMFVMVSPLEAHLKETITSLRFATKVHNTHIGTAKSTKKLGRATTPESSAGR